MTRNQGKGSAFPQEVAPWTIDGGEGNKATLTFSQVTISDNLGPYAISVNDHRGRQSIDLWQPGSGVFNSILNANDDPSEDTAFFPEPLFTRPVTPDIWESMHDSTVSSCLGEVCINGFHYSNPLINGNFVSDPQLMASALILPGRGEACPMTLIQGASVNSVVIDHGVNGASGQLDVRRRDRKIAYLSTVKLPDVGAVEVQSNE